MGAQHSLVRVWLFIALAIGALAPGVARPPAVAAALAAEPVVPAAPPGCGPGSLAASNNASQPIADAGIITSTINIAGQPGYLWDVNVTTHISHTFAADLEVFLISPAGTIATLTTDNGGGNDHVFAGTVWDDQAPAPVTRYAFANGVLAPHLQPEEALGAFLGENPNGAWQLVVQDDAAIDTGTLNGWSLHITSLAIEPVSIVLANQSNAAANIPDNGVITRTLGIGLRGGLDAPLASIRMTTTISHPLSSDLRLFLIAPDRHTSEPITATVVYSRTGALANLFNGTVWYDKAGQANPPGPVTDNALPPSGTAMAAAVSESPLALFTSRAGPTLWSLRVEDSNANGQAGQVLGWGLEATFLTCRPLAFINILPSLSYPIPGQPVQHILTVSNVGYTATSGVVTYTLPVDDTLLSVSAPGGVCQLPPSGPGGSLVCNYGTFGQNITRTITANMQMSPVPHVLVNQVSAALTAFGTPSLFAEANLWRSFFRAANGMPWAVHDYTPPNCPECDSGALEGTTQGAFTAFGYLRLLVMDENGDTIGPLSPILKDFDLDPSPSRRWTTGAPQNVFGVSVRRALYAPLGEDYVRYIDTFRNTSGEVRQVLVGWGGKLRSDQHTVVSRSSSGDSALTIADTWGVTILNAGLDPNGATIQGPAGFAFRDALDNTYQGPAVMGSPVLGTPYPNAGEDDLAHTFWLHLAPGETASLAYFLYQGRAETVPSPPDCDVLGNCATLPASSQAGVAATYLAALVADPPLCDVAPAQRANIRNWPGAGELNCPSLLYLPLVRR
jgi:subtilisin-like proprotein convertase family protein